VSTIIGRPAMPAERGDAAEESPATPGDWLYRAPHRTMGL